MQQYPIKRVNKIKGGCTKGSLQWDRTSVQITPKWDVPKQADLKLKLRGCHLCVVGRHQKITQRWHLMKKSKTKGHFDHQQDQVDEGSGTRSRIMIRWILEEDTACWLWFMRPPEGVLGSFQSKMEPCRNCPHDRDDLDVTEAVILNHITAILCVGRWSAGEGLTEEEVEACMEHFSPYTQMEGSSH